MAAQGATLQNYNNELVKCVDDLKEKREEVNKAILKDVRANRSSAVTAAGRRVRARGGAGGRVVGAPAREGCRPLCGCWERRAQLSARAGACGG